MDQDYTLFTAPGSGGMIVEAAFAVAAIPVKAIHVDWDDLGWQSKTLMEYNPLGQIPTLLLPDGQVMTESAAMILHLADRNPTCPLVPPPDHPARSEFLRWLVFLVSAIYPTFTYGDVPARWVENDEESAVRLRRGTDAHRITLFRYMEERAGDPWYLDEDFTALDLYLWIMRHWRPGEEWFEAECPRLNAIGLRTAEVPAVAGVQQRNFPSS